ncbi:hypothetical protein T05_235 [Trichinella murrelli]|uniref:Uncharacterized protein n=1 Tax=Trichinella murrelli TaxID=144512 RepID=A0A0V0TZW0_9BILA|nr:hypothetical protein T05_235 [Trichinella murrelli]
MNSLQASRNNVVEMVFNDKKMPIQGNSKKNEAERETKSMYGYRGSLFCRSGVVIFQKDEVIP